MTDEWREVALEEVAHIQMGLQLSPSRAAGRRLRPYLRAANVSPGSIDLSDVKEMSFDEAEEARYALHVGDVLLVEGGNEKSLGSPALVSQDEEGLCFQNTLVRLRVRDTSVLTPEFLLLTQDHLFS